MSAQQHSPPHDSSPTDSSARKRVCKACDRCRLKKSKCDGASPCSRCKTDNAICVFGERKKSHDKVYPKGYVEMLEQQQAQLVSGLQELYKRTQHGQGWAGKPLKESHGGHPLTHDILERLGALKIDSNGDLECFEEDLSLMQQRLIESGAGLMQRQLSPDSDSDPSTFYETKPSQAGLIFSDPFAMNRAPPTPPMHSPFPSTSNSHTPLKTSYNLNGAIQLQTGLNPAHLQRSSWATQPSTTFDDMDYINSLDSPAGLDISSLQYDCLSMPATTSGSCLMPDWNEDDEFSAFLNPTAV
ncbi:MAG: hypothetical protein M1827_000160 [Pycnora praestabilis]|nr:MAG: hypothetical protein M1827_000160 [Pycnora praestabilis]